MRKKKKVFVCVGTTCGSKYTWIR